jgi:two-component system cell cycle response regulator DivK
VTLVLIVDDNQSNRKLGRVVLGGAGFQTIEAATGEEAIRLAIEHAPDVILMDLQLPDINGAEAARRIDANPRTARIPVLAISALPLQGSGEWLEASGFSGWIQKPIRVAQFADEVRRHCAGTGS